MKLKNNKWMAFVVYLNIVFFFRLMRSSYDIISFNYTYVTVVFMFTFVFYYIYEEFLIYKKYKALILILIIIIGSIFIFLKREEVIVFLKETIENVSSINSNLAEGKGTNFYQFKNIILLLLPVLSIITFFLYSKGFTKFLLVINTLAMLFFWYLDYERAMEGNLFYYALICVIGFSAESNLRNMKKINMHNIRPNIKKGNILSQVIFYGILIGMTIKITPTEVKGKYEEILIEKVRDIITVEDKEGKFSGKRYGLSVSGYNDSDKTLGGKITLDNKSVMKVKANKSYHLKGSVKDVYTGSSWITITNDSRDSLNTSTNKYLYQYKEVEKDELYIKPEGIKSSTIFTPIYTLSINLQDDREIYKNEDTDIYVASKPLYQGYKIDFIEEERVIELLPKVNTYYGDINLDRYTQIPPTVTDRTKKLVYDIIKDSKDPLEKSKKIREYLEKNYSYSLEVSDVPEESDFVDYFLFEEKKGYCVYFATATTVMNRIAGVPARYVEGFKMPNEKYDSDFYMITNKDAHAWSEILVDAPNMIWGINDAAPTAREYEISLIRPIIPSRNNQNPDEEFMQKPNKKAVDEIEDSDNKNTNENTFFNIYNIFKIISIILIILYVIIKIIMEKWRKNIILNEKNYKFSYFYLERRLKTIKIKRELTETEGDFVKRINDIELRNMCLDLVENLYKEYYGDHNPEDFSWNEFYFTLEEYLKTQGKIKYYLCKYILPYRIKTTP
ncbi:transglutaminase-like domain-containing protein [Clostridium amazonitimonense]|uniref:transglutaminase-like domain-containing protein n=1 Tax=Clostridium amazonitimonense TaxID=1499689 RepID=UPI000509B9EB|nr:transglutaminase domain-containing protein [Clostridium amazonitimonense]